MAERLRLLAADEADLETISALMQDAVVKAADIAFDARARRLVLMANRYRWEDRVRSRVRTALRIDVVLGVQHRNWQAAGTLDLLALRSDGTHIDLDFAGGAALRCAVECIDVEMHDLAGPWGAKMTPRHDV